MVARPVQADEFALAIKAAASFEDNPHLAIAVSGGADSMSLALLARDWADGEGGRVTALVVDHGLRESSATEAKLTQHRLSELNIPSIVLEWTGKKPTSDIQARARTARYQLMNDWCRENDVLHLLTGHHADDQAETFMMRVQRGSGPDGLAAMAAVRMLPSCQIIRPLLTFPKERLIATLLEAGVNWIEDLSNTDTKFDRVRVRRDLKRDAADIQGIVLGAARFRRARHALEAQVSEWIARFVDLRAEGYLQFPSSILNAANSEIRLRMLSRVITAIGGQIYPPSIASVERLDRCLQAGKGGTLGGVRIAFMGENVLACREARNLPAEITMSDKPIHWDHRFIISSERQEAGHVIVPWTSKIATEVQQSERPNWFQEMPDCVRQSFPVIKSDNGYALVRPGCRENTKIFLQFSPKIPLSGGGFSVA